MGGAGALLTGFGPTCLGYFLQGGLKFGGYELFKKVIVENIGMKTAQENRMSVYLAASALAEFVADIALCPLEATRIRLVSQPTFASGLAGGFARIAREEGVMGFYAGFGPILQAGALQHGQVCYDGDCAGAGPQALRQEQAGAHFYGGSCVQPWLGSDCWFRRCHDLAAC